MIYNASASMHMMTKPQQLSTVNMKKNTKSTHKKIGLNQLIEIHRKLESDCLTILKKKNADYGGKRSIFSNFRAVESLNVHPVTGVLVRMMDKIARIQSFIDNGKLENESLEDAIMDIRNYATIILGIIEETK